MAQCSHIFGLHQKRMTEVLDNIFVYAIVKENRFLKRKEVTAYDCVQHHHLSE